MHPAVRIGEMTHINYPKVVRSSHGFYNVFIGVKDVITRDGGIIRYC